MNQLYLLFALVLTVILPLTAMASGQARNSAPVQKVLQEKPANAPAGASLIQECGRLSFLRAHDVGTGFGPPSDFIDVEVVAKLANDPPKAFGFQLRQDANAPTRSGMLDLLRDAFNNNWTVCMDFYLVPGKNNGTVIRVALQK